VKGKFPRAAVTNNKYEWEVNMKKFITLCIAATLLISMLGVASAGAVSGIQVGLSTEPISMDPHIGNDSNTSTALMMAFEGLLNAREGKFTPGMAESYTISEDGMTYTFHLRDAKWSDGVPVTAKDFADTWARMLTRKDAMDLAYLIFPIKNAEAINKGEMDVSELGVKAVDDKTLEVTLSAPYPFMVTLFASSPMYPIRIDLVEKYGNAYGNDAGTFASNGPYLMKEWAHNDKLVFEKNPDYWDAASITFDTVEIIAITDPNTMKNMFDNGDLLWMDIPSPDMIPTYEGTPGFSYFNAGGVTFIALSYKGTSAETAKFTTNRNFLMALSSAIDREGLVRSMYPQNAPFTGVINPVISNELGGKWGDIYDVKDKYHKVKADPEAAKQYLAEAMKELGYAAAADLPAFDFFTTAGDLQRTLSEYFQSTWAQVLGVKINIRQLEFTQYWENLYNQPYDIVRTGWGPDYDDPFTYLDMWNSNGGWNKTGWVDEEYNQLMIDANKEQDFAKRNEMFLKAEEILLTRAPIIPLLVSRGAYVISPKIENLYVNTFGARFDFRYAKLAK